MITLKKIATYKKVWFLQALFAWLWLGISAQAHADSYDDLYELAGWKQQAVHFEQALPLLQQEITQKTGFTPSISWQPQAFQRKATETLRQQLVSPQAALDFFNSKAGMQVVKAEVNATQLSKIKTYRHQPSWSLDVTRQRELDRLRASLPIQAALNQLQSQIIKQQTNNANLNIPGLGDLSTLTSGALQNISLFKPSTYDINQAMIIVYGDLSHPELKAFADFAESAEGQAYYNACVQMLQF
ncbi:hypothetical protein VQ643_06535 [Pseudomonas sp. F1_0610]|uniref:hypothetical protein n=1 Tax=Pseudomonas sp. F1_0610 TaxID=3114284 RepID=UPI0039C03208